MLKDVLNKINSTKRINEYHFLFDLILSFFLVISGKKSQATKTPNPYLPIIAFGKSQYR